MEKKIEKGFFKDDFMDLIEPMVEDTDNGKALKERIAELKRLLTAYRTGLIKEKK